MAPPPPLDEDDDYEDPLEEAICAQRVRLSEREVCNLWDNFLPRAELIGAPFVTRLTSTMIDRHVMSLSESCGIEADEEGYAGIRLTARGPVTTCAYGVETDGRTHLSTDGWKSFLVDKNLHVGQAILITIRKTNRQGLKMMIVIDII
ncbi:uncharacterized protein LOC119295283 [Triticum dicoccoides]|uniref:uncharacterized protein LOC119295283 n=1 Tax=Triticum dicoccoides TaxID=85692 RepID=UPI001890A20E|nr:uncharacterized protein LOC119295283 [Triticum dicoccoides]